MAGEGGLVYTIDAALGSGMPPLKVVGDSGNGEVGSYPRLVDGQSVTIWGYTITVRTTAYYTDTVTVTKAGDP